MEQDNNQKQSSTEELAENMSFAIATGVKVFFWLWSLVIGIIALGMFFSNVHIPAILMMGAAVFCNPYFLQYAFNEAVRKGESPPSIFLYVFLAFAFFCSSIGFAIYQSASEMPVEANQQNNESIKSSNIPAHEVQQQVEAFTQTRKNIQLVIESLNENYGIKATNEYQKNYCSNDKFCTIYADTVQIQAMGYIVNPLVNSQVTPSYYQQVCSAVLIALSGGANKELAEQAIVQYFDYAAQNGSARSNILGVDMRVTSNSRGLLECRFVKKW